MDYRKPLPGSLLLALLLNCVSPAHAELPLITDARVSATPPGASVAAGYLTLTNSSKKPLVLHGVSSTTVPTVELHLTTISNDVASMQQQDEVTIPPGKTLAFAHGGYHLMLMDLQAPLEPGDVIDLTLDTSAGEVDVSMPVTEIGMAESDDGMQTMDHGSMDHDSMDHDAMGHESMDDGSTGHGSKDHGSMDHDAMGDEPVDDGSTGHGSMDHDAMNHNTMDDGSMDQDAMNHEIMEESPNDHGSMGQ